MVSASLPFSWAGNHQKMKLKANAITRMINKDAIMRKRKSARDIFLEPIESHRVIIETSVIAVTLLFVVVEAGRPFMDAASYSRELAYVSASRSCSRLPR
jgi:hypothetical protein